jgi:hypothetical protein
MIFEKKMEKIAQLIPKKFDPLTKTLNLSYGS